jgi:hypothetical protein
MSRTPAAIGVLNPPPYMAERSVTDQRMNLMFNPCLVNREGYQPQNVERYHSMMADDTANPYSYKIQIPSTQSNCGGRR